ncbi:MAG TPA: hypothetical protein VFO02_06550, partial [Burkholderiales bacterium]|nr:hypothetical protein [Burkholderiales bacterium]
GKKGERMGEGKRGGYKGGEKTMGEGACAIVRFVPTVLEGTIMNILFTALALAAFCGCLLALQRALKAADLAHGHYLKAEAQTLTLKAERDRVTVLERDTEALRRELRKLSGKFYASRRDMPFCGHADRDGNGVCRYCGDREPSRAEQLVATKPCDNWIAAQTEGPRSEAARCECLYCMTQRRIRATEKAAILAARAATKPVNGGE